MASAGPGATVICPATIPDLIQSLARYADAGGVLDYFAFGSRGPDRGLAGHRLAALRAMAELDHACERNASKWATPDLPVDRFFRIRWDDTKLVGTSVTLDQFWGDDDVSKRPMAENAWSVPDVTGYKAAFFHPPHGIRGTRAELEALFADINAVVLGRDPARADIVSWSTDWSNYFDAGHEWWGAFYWTVRPADSDHVFVVGASTTD